VWSTGSPAVADMSESPHVYSQSRSLDFDVDVRNRDELGGRRRWQLNEVRMERLGADVISVFRMHLRKSRLLRHHHYLFVKLRVSSHPDKAIDCLVTIVRVLISSRLSWRLKIAPGHERAFYTNGPCSSWVQTACTWAAKTSAQCFMVS
jgi:aromatic ring-cleaving dioxygenase